MADNTAALQLINQKITGLQVVQQALTNLYTQAKRCAIYGNPTAGSFAWLI